MSLSHNPPEMLKRRFSELRNSPTGLAVLLALLGLLVRIIYLIESAENPFREHLNLDGLRRRLFYGTFGWQLRRGRRIYTDAHASLCFGSSDSCSSRD